MRLSGDKIWQSFFVEQSPWRQRDLAGAGDGGAGHLHGTRAVGLTRARLERNPVLATGTGVRKWQALARMGARTGMRRASWEGGQGSYGEGLHDT